MNAAPDRGAPAPVRSMTGMGVAAGTVDGRAATVEVRSVNHRQLKLSLKAPYALCLSEPEIEARVRAKHARGAFTLVVDVADATSGAAPLDADALVARTEEILRIAAKAGVVLGRAEAFAHALRLPGASAAPASAGAPSDATAAAVHALVDAALDRLSESRAAEGAKTVAALRVHLAEVARLRAAVAARAPEIVRGLRDRFAERARALLAEVRPDVALSEESLLREAAILAERVDVAEELQRLEGHVERFESILRDGRDVGRALDFLLQEMLRETNTLGSKASDLATAHDVVALKCEIEKLKEQVQNLE